VIGNWKMNVDKARIDNIVKFMSAASLDPNTGQFRLSLIKTTIQLVIPSLLCNI